ncbi:MAG: Gfo/Idh/MocA family oxidoreductase [Armatimonadetes bacterium]|nr:Gfo/Idh/MocA family oxidoreductase [Armatimonadota bacterium]
MSDIGIGIVGYGLAGRVFHRPLIDATPGLRIAGIAARSADKAERAREENPEATIVDSLEALCGLDEVDLVVLATPHDVHCEQTIAALEAGRAVVVDKIMARSVAEADAMIAAAERNRQLLTVFHNRRWDSDWLTVRAALNRGLLGQVWSVDIAVTRPVMPLAPLGADRRWRARREAFGGQLVDWGAHLMDQAVLLAGSQPEQVFCDLQYRQAGNDNDTEAFVALRYADGLRVTVTSSVQTWLAKPHWFVSGSAGTLVIEGIDPQEAMVARTGRVVGGTPEASLSADSVHLTTAEPVADFGPVPGNWPAFYANVREALQGNAELAVRPVDCRDVLRLYEQCFRAAGRENETTGDRPGGLLR